MTEDTIDVSALKRLLEVIGGDQDDLQELIDDFAELAPEILENMRDAVDKSDTTALRIAAHSLKSNGRDLGATSLADACATLETACQNDSVVNAAESVEAIAVEVGHARDALSRLSGFG